MISLKRGLVYSLLLAVGLLVAGLVALLWVADTREQRYEDELQDLRRHLMARDAEIRQLRQQPKPTLPATDSTWSDWPVDTSPATR